MFKVDYSYYKNEYGGKLNEDEFRPLSISACSLVDMYTFNRISSDNVIDEVKNAVCELVDFINAHTDEKIISSEKIGQSNITIYNKVYDDDKGYDTYQRTVIKGVHFEDSKGANVIKSGLENADRASIYVPFKSEMSRQYLSPIEFKKLDDKSKYFTFEKGDRLIKGDIDFEPTTEKSIDENYDAFTITSVDIFDFGSENMRHFELGAR